ncbi:UNVERIFIED_CONTAM: hypothetical protein RMT77_011241 [Armadillidium vulgare]
MESEKAPLYQNRPQKGGIFLTTSAIVLVIVAFLASLLATGLIVHYLSAGGSKETFEGNSSQCSQASKNLRLPPSLKPVHYNVKIQPFVTGNFSIHGHVEIIFEVVEETTSIILHLLDIITVNETIKLVSYNDSNEVIEFVSHSYNRERHFYIGMLKSVLKIRRTYILSMNYVGYMNENMVGFYRSSYVQNNKTIYLGATQMEATHARRVFPCFDEPALKATFNIHIARQEGYRVISNMPSRSSLPIENQDGWFWEIFNSTLPMSTYLIAFVVSDFEFNASVETSGTVPFNIWARQEAISQTEYAAYLGPKVLKFYEEYFGIAFPLPKQDMAALPDFKSGAMENWGLITYRETALLYDSQHSKALDKQRIGLTIAHELAHMWFGDLVSPKWWSELWLNEGFATYMEHIGLHSVEPSFKMLEQIVISELYTSFSTDVLDSSHPINVEVNDPEEIDQIFDAISYSKGASIIRMMNYSLTEVTFRKGLYNYLNELSYSSATQDDLWYYLTLEAHKDGTLDLRVTVKEIMESWTLQKGFPVVTVVSDRRYSSFLITQEKFTLISAEEKEIKSNQTWWIPLTFTTQSNPDFTQAHVEKWMSVEEKRTILTGLSTDRGWFIFNVQQSGYYRVNYELRNWIAIINQLKTDPNVIGILNRAQIIDDSFNLARSGKLDYKIPIQIGQYLSQERELVPWLTALNNFEYLRIMFERTSTYGYLKDYITSVATPLYNSLGFKDSLEDPHDIQLLRSSLLSSLCRLGFEDCVTNAKKLYSEWMEAEDSSVIISANLRKTVYCVGVAEGGLKEWNFAWKKYLKSNLGSEKDNLLYALGCSKDVSILKQYVERSFSEEGDIRKQDVYKVVNTVSENLVGREVVWKYLKANWSQIATYFTQAKICGEFTYTITSSFNTEKELQMLYKLKAERYESLESATLSFDQAVESVELNVYWMKHHYQEVYRWLNFMGYIGPYTFGEVKNEPKEEKDISYYRLPNTTLPTEQFIRLQPFVDGNNTISGYTEITFQVFCSSSSLTLHMADIITFNDSIRVVPTMFPNETIPIVSHIYDPERNFYICNFGADLEQGKTYIIYISYMATLNDNLLGFYKSFYTEANGTVNEFAVTQYAPTAARYTFPCYDEPAIKAKYRIEIIREKRLNAISNMPKISSLEVPDQPGWFSDTFEQTLPMSVYLLAFLVSDLQIVPSNSDVTFRAITSEATVKQIAYALDIAPPILKYYDNYFEIVSPIPKQDIAAVPDFFYGAMENWGLVIYRETRVLYDPAVSSALDKQRVCAVVAHELSHGWYGNLVTMNWWDEVWLNEGFASYMEYRGCNSVEPDFGILDYFLLEDFQKAMKVDMLSTAHPLTNNITTPGQIQTIYDTIAYSKGASVIRMMNGFLTEETFRKGASHYVGNFSYSAVTKDDLWKHLTEQGHIDQTLPQNLTMKQIMDPWTLQPGFPLVTVNRPCDGTAVITQTRFLVNSTEENVGSENLKWWIPLTFTFQNSANFADLTVKEWISNTESFKIIKGFPSSDQWVIFNLQAMGYYRVNYDAENWNALIAQFKSDFNAIHTLNRAQILDDGYSLAKAGILPYETILDINSYLSQETDYVPIATDLNQIEFLTYMFATTSLYGKWKAYMTDLAAPLYKSVGFRDRSSDTHEVQLKRSLILTWACKIRYGPCVDTSSTYYAKWMKYPENVRIITPNIRKPVYCASVEAGDQTEWDFAYTQYVKTSVGNEKLNLLYGMGCTRVIWLINRYLELTFNDTSGIRKQDIVNVFDSLSQNPVGNEVAWNFLRENKDHINQYGGPNTISDVTDLITNSFNTQTKLNELTAFQLSLGKSVDLKQSIEKVKHNIQWLNTYYDVIGNWLRKTGY